MAKAIINIHGIISSGEDGKPSMQDYVFAEIDKAIKAKATEIEFSLTTIGGTALMGFAIYDRIKELKIPTTAKIYGYCMSAGTIIACACDKVIAGEGATYMIHDSHLVAHGNKETIQSSIRNLEHTDKKMSQVYHQKTGLPLETIRSLMSANQEGGTMMTAQEALEMGFVDSIDTKINKEQMAQAIMACYQISDNKPKTKTNMAKTAMEKFSAAAAQFLGIKAAAEAPLQDGNGTLFAVGFDNMADVPVGTVIGYQSADMGYSNATEGDHTLSDGAVVAIDGEGKLVSYTAPATAEKDEEEEPKAEKEDYEKKIAEAEAKIKAEVTASFEKKLDVMAMTMERVLKAMGDTDQVKKGTLPKAQSAERSPNARLTKEQEELKRLQETRERNNMV